MSKQDNGKDAVDPFGRVLTLKSDIRQRDAAAWNRVYSARRRTALADERQACLEAAIEAGWIESPACRWEDVTDGETGKKERRYYFDGVLVDDMLPSEVNLYGRQCSAHFDAAIAVPKASPSQ